MFSVRVFLQGTHPLEWKNRLDGLNMGRFELAMFLLGHSAVRLPLGTSFASQQSVTHPACDKKCRKRTRHLFKDSKMNAPKTGETYQCQKCEFEIQVTQGCNCSECKTELNCCGQGMQKVAKTTGQKSEATQGVASPS